MEDNQATEMVTDATEAETVVPAEPNPALDNYNENWKAVHENLNDFTSWTVLIASAEKLDDLERLKAVYEPFLASFPLSYGYWKKYAEAEARHQSVATALEIYERGTTATPYSMDLWGAYASYKKSNEGTAEEVRGIYERALSYNSSDYLSHSLWDKYISFEEEQGSSTSVAALYVRVLRQPIKQLDVYMRSLQTFAQGRSASELMPAEEVEALTTRLSDQKKPSEGDAPQIDTSVSDDEIKAAWLAEQEAACKAAKEVAQARQGFEEAIRRPYFHPRPLDAAQLVNWGRYLDHMEAQAKEHGGEHVAAATLVYERCLVACAAYSEFWERYVRWLESGGRLEEADHALARGVGVFCKAHPEMHLFAARYDERRGRVQEARERYDHVLDKLAPTLLQAVVASANFERRQGRTDVACARWDGLLSHEREREDGKGSKLYPFLAMQYATFLRQVCKDTDKARGVLEQALTVVPQVRQVWEAAIHLEENAGGADAMGRIMALYDRAVAPVMHGAPKGLNDKDREEMSLRRVEFADMFLDVEQLAKADRAHAAHFMLPANVAASAAANAAATDPSRKRAADGMADRVADGGAAKVARTDAAATAAAAVASTAAVAAAPEAVGVVPAAADAAAMAAYYQQYGQYPAAAYGPYPGYGAYPGYGYPGYG